MGGNEVWARCGDCGVELKQSDKQCPACGSGKKTYKREASTSIGLVCSAKSVHRRKGIKKPLREMIGNRWKPSGDPTLEHGVREDMVVDREKDEYHHITRHARTGEITHEEHEKLSQHNKKEGE
jgi:RNA polymerase subunit RPABC4/transcription elongation factor Spt4